MDSWSTAPYFLNLLSIKDFKNRANSCLAATQLFHCIELVITLYTRNPEKVSLNLPSNGIGYIALVVVLLIFVM